MAQFDRQTSFIGGEFSPQMWGRSDLELYRHGARTLLNFFVSKYGSALSRPGTLHVDYAQVVSESISVNLIPFIFSNEDSLILMLSASSVQDRLRIRFVEKSGSDWRFVENGFGQVLVVEVDDWTDAKSLTYTQVGDVITFMPGPKNDAKAFELKRLSSSNDQWEVNTLTFTKRDFLQVGTWMPTIIRYMPSNTSVSPIDVTSAGTDEWYWKVTQEVELTDGSREETAPIDVSLSRQDSIAPWSEHAWFLAAVDEDDALNSDSERPHWAEWSSTSVRRLHNRGAGLSEDSGVLETNNAPSPHPSITGTSNDDFWESVSVSDFPSWKWAVFGTPVGTGYDLENHPVKIDWEKKEFDASDTDVDASDDVQRVVRHKIYRGRDGIFGLVGVVEDDGESFIDDGSDPDFSQPPPSEENPFIVDGDNDYPRAVTRHQGRMYYGGTPLRPDKVWGSGVEDYRDLTEEPLPSPSDPLRFVLGSNRLEIVRHMLPYRGLVVLTEASEWFVTGSNNGIILPNDINAVRVGNYGAGTVPPVRIREDIVYAQSKDAFPVVATWQERGVAVSDLAPFSGHIFEGLTIISWAYAQDPWSVLWVTLSDGTLAALSYSIESGVAAWSRCEVASGRVKAVASVPDGSEDAVFMLVWREDSGRLFLEQLSTRVYTDERDPVSLDAAVTYDGRNTDSDTKAKVTSTPPYTDSEGNTESFESPIAVEQNYDVDVVLPEDTAGTYTGEVLRVNGDGDLSVLVRLHTNDSQNNYTGTLLSFLHEDMDGEEFSDWEIVRNSISGLSHLSGQEVYAYNDGSVIGPFTVSGDTLGFGSSSYNYYGVIRVGLRYNCDFLSLDYVQERWRQKVVRASEIEVYGTRGAWVGQSLSNLTEALFREVDDSWGAAGLDTRRIKVNIEGSYDLGGRVALRQVDPVPVTLLGISRELEVGGA